MRPIFCLLALLAIAIFPATLRAQDDTARLREGRLYAESLATDTAGKGLRCGSLSHDNPRLTPSQGRTTAVEYYADAVGRILLIHTSRATGQLIWQASYYLRDGALLYATEEEVLNLKSGEDHGAVIWSAGYAFRGAKLVGLTSNGHGISESDEWQPEVQVPADFKRARAWVTAHIRRGAAAR